MRWFHHRAHRRSYVAAVIALLAVSLSVLSGCADTETYTYQDLGAHVTTMKVLNGTYLTNRDGHLLVLSGTEVLSPETSQVFLYDIDQRELLFSSRLDNSLSMTAFCQAGETLYFATIASESTGCDVYAVDDRGENFHHVVHLDERGIYSLEWDGQQELLIGTAYPANLYGYTPETDTLRLISDSLTDENFVFNISYLDGYCYLGIGTNAEFLKVDCQTGEYQDILPAQYADQASVYDQIIYQDEIYLFLSPDGEGVRYEPETGTFAGIGTGEPLIQDTGEIAPEVVKSMAEAAACLNITERLLVRGEYSTQAYQTGMKFSYYDDRDDSFYGVDISGFLHQYQDGVEVSQVNLGALLEPTYITPTEMVAYDGVVYFPSRHFTTYRVSDGEAKQFLVKSEPQASTVTRNGVYTANYTSADVWFYPFATFEADPESVNLMNVSQYQIADIDHQARPTQMDVTTDGRYLAIGTGPLYGNFGGAVSIYDLQEETLLYTAENVVPNHRIQSVCCSTSMPSCVWLGSSPYGENTSPQYLEEPSHLILWDIPKQEIILDIIPDEEMKKIASIAEVGDRVYCITQDGLIHAFDTNTGDDMGVNRKEEFYELLVCQDGTLLAVNETSISEIDPETLNATVRWDGFSLLSHLTEDPVTGQLYCLDEERLIFLKH